MTNTMHKSRSVKYKKDLPISSLTDNKIWEVQEDKVSNLYPAVSSFYINGKRLVPSPNVNKGMLPDVTDNFGNNVNDSSKEQTQKHWYYYQEDCYCANSEVFGW